MKLPADKAVFLQTCGAVFAGCCVVGLAFGSLKWGAFVGLIAIVAIFLSGDA